MITFRDIPVGTRYLVEGLEDAYHPYSVLDYNLVFTKISTTASQCECGAIFNETLYVEVYPILEQYDVSQD